MPRRIALRRWDAADSVREIGGRGEDIRYTVFVVDTSGTDFLEGKKRASEEWGYVLGEPEV